MVLSSQISLALSSFFHTGFFTPVTTPAALRKRHTFATATDDDEDDDEGSSHSSEAVRRKLDDGSRSSTHRTSEGRLSVPVPLALHNDTMSLALAYLQHVDWFHAIRCSRQLYSLRLMPSAWPHQVLSHRVLERMGCYVNDENNRRNNVARSLDCVRTWQNTLDQLCNDKDDVDLVMVQLNAATTIRQWLSRSAVVLIHISEWQPRLIQRVLQLLRLHVEHTAHAMLTMECIDILSIDEFALNIVAHGGIPVLVQLLRQTTHPRIQMDVIRVLRGLAKNLPANDRNNYTLLMKDGLVDVFLSVDRLTKTIQQPLLSEMVWLCRDLIISYHVPVRKSGADLHPLLPMMTRVLLLSSWMDQDTFNNVCEVLMVMTHSQVEVQYLNCRFLVESRAVPRLVELLQYPWDPVAIRALYILNNIVLFSDLSLAVAECNPFAYLARFLSGTNSLVKQQVVKLCGNIMVDGLQSGLQALLESGLLTILLENIDIKTAWFCSMLSGFSENEQLNYAIVCGLIPCLCRCIDVCHADDELQEVLVGLENILHLGRSQAHRESIRTGFPPWNVYRQAVRDCGGMDKLRLLAEAKPKDDASFSPALATHARQLVQDTFCAQANCGKCLRRSTTTT